MQDSHNAMPRLCVVGTGALGSALLRRLRDHRFGSVLLVDPDTVQARNLALSPLTRRALNWREASGGQTPTGNAHNKAKLLAGAAQALDGLPWRAAPCEIADLGWQELRSADLICCCTDSVLSRLETAWAARSLNRPMLDGGVMGEGRRAGRMTAFPPCKQAACALCGLTEDRRASILGFAASASLGCRAPEDVPAMTGALATLDAVADAMLQQIRRWPESASATVTRRITSEDGDVWRAEDIVLTRSASCPWHDGPTGSLEPLRWEEPVRGALRSGERELMLSWPICAEAVCSACGERSRPMVRVARVRNSTCQRCGQHMQEPLAVIQRIRYDDVYASFTLRQLGLPAQHLYWLRDTTPRPAGDI